MTAIVINGKKLEENIIDDSSANPVKSWSSIKIMNYIAETKDYPSVNTYDDLPDPANNNHKIYFVKIATGTMFINRKKAGLYRSDGIKWRII